MDLLFSSNFFETINLAMPNFSSILCSFWKKLIAFENLLPSSFRRRYHYLCYVHLQSSSFCFRRFWKFFCFWPWDVFCMWGSTGFCNQFAIYHNHKYWVFKVLSLSLSLIPSLYKLWFWLKTIICLSEFWWHLIFAAAFSSFFRSFQSPSFCIFSADSA